MRLSARESSGPNRARRTRNAAKVVAVAAAATAGLALWNTWRARKVEREHPPSGKFLTIDGVRLHYLDRGAGSPVVLLHGNVVTAEDFALSGLLDRLAKHHRVIAFDRPGFGYSDRPRGMGATPSAQAELLHRALAELDVARPIVVGHSFGAIVALALALDQPQAVRGLVLLSGYYHPTRRADVALSSLAVIPIIGDIMRYTVSPLLGAMVLPLIFKGMFAPNAVPQHFADGFPRGFPVRPSQIRAESEDGAGMSAAVAGLQGRYGSLLLPVFVVAGTDDRVVDVHRHSERLADEIPSSVLHLVSDAGHMVHYIAPNEIADAIERLGALSSRSPTASG